MSTSFLLKRGQNDCKIRSPFKNLYTLIKILHLLVFSNRDISYATDSMQSHNRIGFAFKLQSEVTSNKCIAVHKVATPLRELTCHMGSHSVTCHPAEVTFPPLPQPKLVLD